MKNNDGLFDVVLGVSIDKEFMPSVANIIGTDLTKYNVVSRGVFACNPMHVGRDERLPVALYKNETPALVSPAYFMFKVNDENMLLPEYLHMLFKTPLFDHLCWFHTDASVRGGLTWNDLCDLDVYIPDIDIQKTLVESYNKIINRKLVVREFRTTLEKRLVLLFEKSFKPLESKVDSNSTLAALLSFDNGYAFKSDDYLENGKYKIITIKNVGDGFLNLFDVNYITEVEPRVLKNNLLHQGDIVISLTGNVGRTALITEDNLLLNQRVARIVPKKPSYKNFIYCLFRHPETRFYLEGLSSGTAQQNLSPVELVQTKISYSYEAIESFSNSVQPFMDLITLLSIETREIDNITKYFYSKLEK